MDATPLAIRVEIQHLYLPHYQCTYYILLTIEPVTTHIVYIIAEGLGRCQYNKHPGGVCKINTVRLQHVQTSLGSMHV